MLKKLWKYFDPYKFLLLLTLLMSAVAAATDGALAYIVKPTLDGIFIEKNSDLLKILPFAIIGLYTAKSLLRFALNYTMRYMGQRVVQRIRNDLYTKLIYLPIRFFSDNSTGVLMSRITNDVNMMQSSIPTIVAVVRDLLTVVGLICVIFYMNAKMAVFAILVYPIFIHPFVLLSKKIRKYSKKGQEHMGDLTSVLQETFTGIRVVKAFVQEPKEAKRFEEVNGNVVKFALKAAIAAEVTSPMMEIVASLGIAAIIAYGGSQVIGGETTPGAFFAFLAAVTMVYEPVKRLGNSNSTIQQALASAERVFEVLDQDNEILDNDGTAECNAKGKAVEFRNINFRYHTDEPFVLKNINLSVPAGVKVAFVGHSGAGKSTIANLVPRFYDVTEGELLIGGVDLREYQVHSLRENIGYVSQEPFLFNDSVFNNIAYSSEPYTQEQVEEAARAAFAHDFITNLSEGYETVIGERGVRLSGGQKQRLTIARALLKNPPILILDEATSSLDTESEREVQRALDNLMLGRTSFIIAHRLTTVINADMIVVLDHGEIQAVGRHAELLESCEIYRNLYQMQSSS
ncbi:MAG: ABC transporter ATP-binding protein/permease [Deferribacteraceae bacterium]|jgi:subfamily B ATP-binding cassette protein MsbA|nr:ABC transporter ATP-binding protein/permease [Deferribacteraceae bacterium]